MTISPVTPISAISTTTSNTYSPIKHYNKVKCPAGCGRIFISKEHAERHADKEHPDWRTPKARGWATSYGFIDFSHPVTFEEACTLAKSLVKDIQ